MRLMTIGLAVLYVAACSAPEESVSRSAEEDRASVLSQSRAFSAAYVAGDTAGVREVYMTDAMLLPPGREIAGQDAIVRYFGPVENRTNLAHAMTSSRLDIIGDVAIDVGTWSNTWRIGDGEEQTASERYLVVWRRGPDGVWRILQDMWHRPTG